MIIDSTMVDAELGRRVKALFHESQDKIYRRTDHLFVWLMLLQWLAGIGAALWISPRTWIGTTSLIHWHVWAAIFLGGLIAGFPIFLAWKQPGHTLTRHTIAVAQMTFSALLIHLTGGRIEAHFHIFGSLAFLAFYRDWRVLVTAMVVTTVDHFMRGMFWPQSIFGIMAANHWRWVEHAGWIVFEDVFLMISIRQSLGEMFEVAARRAALETVNAKIGSQVAERTAELTVAQEELAQVSRRAGMAEVATSVLHNVGNVLNSVNVASSCLADNIRKSKSANLAKVVGLLSEHEADLGAFFNHDPKGKRLPGYIAQLATFLAGEQALALKELGDLQKHVEHIKEIVNIQQSHAKISRLKETLQMTDMVEDALKMNASSLDRHDIHLIREFENIPPVSVEKHEVLQILVNLVRNATQACDEGGAPEKRLVIRVARANDRVQIAITDNGIGIPSENLTRIFAHGFTTKKTGHGFGLHSGALAAKEMGGSLTVCSDGLNKGATFTLELPLMNTEELHD